MLEIGMLQVRLRAWRDLGAAIIPFFRTVRQRRFLVIAVVFLLLLSPSLVFLAAFFRRVLVLAILLAFCFCTLGSAGSQAGPKAGRPPAWEEWPTGLLGFAPASGPEG
ncbi:MAG: hypothetical protein JRI59_07750 [Deltaproteobacteria bacterium]|nr:hypothetical protein [Deltaproteobacteria bacterium]